MIVNTITGEIVDLSPLGRKPRGRVSRPKGTYRKRRTDIHVDKDLAIATVVIVFLLGAWIA
jgi:hypothetical protein